MDSARSLRSASRTSSGRAAQLDLDVSLRTHRAANAHEWVAALVRGSIEDAARLAGALEDDGFALRLTTDLARAKRFLRYGDEPAKRYGMLASSRARNLRQLGIDNEFRAMQRPKIAKWFNTAQSDPMSYCQLELPATEFQVRRGSSPTCRSCAGAMISGLGERAVGPLPSSGFRILML